MLCRSIMTPSLIIYNQVVTTGNYFAPTRCNFHLLLSTFFFFLLFPPMQSYKFDSSPSDLHESQLTQIHSHRHTDTHTHSQTTHGCANYKMPRRLPSGSVLWHIYGPNGFSSTLTTRFFSSFLPLQLIAS